jgi:hypothetical protein
MTGALLCAILMGQTPLSAAALRAAQKSSAAQAPATPADKPRAVDGGSGGDTPPPDAVKPERPTDGGTGGDNAGRGDDAGRGDNGIVVGQPKQFDERTLALMLQSLEARLASTQFPDPSGLYGSTGNFAGATASTSSMALSVRGPSTPSVTTTVGSAAKDSFSADTTRGSESGTSVEDGLTTSTTGNSLSRTANNSGEYSTSAERQISHAAMAPPTAALPGQASNYSYQPRFGLSPEDLLAEQTSLFYQIVNLRLLLDRSLTDRIDIAPERDREGKPTTVLNGRGQAVLGFQISIDAAHKDAVAEAEITIEGSNPKLVSLLPRDKTYNVASITKDSKAIDVGAVVQFVGVGAGVGKTQESLYLVKDTDTVALERRPSANSVSFAWQFRPVLGRRTVEPGMRQVYALISLPEGASAWEGKVTAATRWRRYDRKNKIAGGVVKGTEQVTQYERQAMPIHNDGLTDFRLRPQILTMKYDDIGNGQALVTVEGERFTPDTQLLLGDTVLDSPARGLVVANEKRLRVLVSAQKLAQTKPTLVNRYGAIEFTPQYVQYPGDPRWVEHSQSPYEDIKLDKPVITVRDPQNSEVKVTLEAAPTAASDFNMRYRLDVYRPVIEVGGRVFGLGDAPFLSRTFSGSNRAAEITFVAPTQLLADARQLVFKNLLWNRGELTADIDMPHKFSAQSVTTLGSSGDRVQLAITGSGFSGDVKVQVGDDTFGTCAAPACNQLKLNNAAGKSTMITLSPTKAQIKDTKYVLVWQGAVQPVPLLLTQPPPPVPTAKIIKPAESISVGKGDSEPVKLEGANFESIKEVLFEGKPLNFELDKDDKTILLLELPSFLTGEVGRKRITFVMKDDKKVPYTVVVTAR